MIGIIISSFLWAVILLVSYAAISWIRGPEPFPKIVLPQEKFMDHFKRILFSNPSLSVGILIILTAVISGIRVILN